MIHALDPWYVIVGPLDYFGHDFINFEPISMKLGDIETSFQVLSNKHIHSTTNKIIFEIIFGKVYSCSNIKHVWVWNAYEIIISEYLMKYICALLFEWLREMSGC